MDYIYSRVDLVVEFFILMPTMIILLSVTVIKIHMHRKTRPSHYTVEVENDGKRADINGDAGYSAYWKAQKRLTVLAVHLVLVYTILVNSYLFNTIGVSTVNYSYTGLRYTRIRTYRTENFSPAETGHSVFSTVLLFGYTGFLLHRTLNLSPNPFRITKRGNERRITNLIGT